MLPIRKVVLYKHGIGYFERQGEVNDDASLDLHFKAAEMNDVLKSLTVLDLTSGLISSISYESTKPVERQLEDIAIHLPDENSLTGLLAQLKGARVSVEVGPKQTEGTVTGIETIVRQEGEIAMQTHYLTLFVGGESLQTFPLLELKRVTFLDDGLKKDFQHLLDILIAAKKKDLKKLTIFANGQGQRSILASYIVETPVWKTSYRVLLGEEKPMLQGWALVDNTQDEDWEGVALSLVAGLPISFVHDLYSPRYKRRPVVQVQEEEAYAPPQLEVAMESYPDQAYAQPMAMGMMSGGAPGGPRMGAPMPAAAAPPAMKAAARSRSMQVQTRTVEVGDLFQYEIKNPVTVKRNQSALVPILQGTFEGKRVGVYNPEVREKNPMTALLFKNTTGMMLEGGPLTVLEDENYVGESMLDTMKPGEERIVPYSVELGCVISLDYRSELQQVRQSTIVNGILYLYQYRIQRKIYIINNKSERPLDLFLEHRFNEAWELVDTDKPVEKTENFYRFRMDVAASKIRHFTVSEKGDEMQSFYLQNVNRDQVRSWLDCKYIDAGTVKVLNELIGINERIADLRRRAQVGEQDVAEIFQNQERLRQNLQALGGTQEEKALREQYVEALKQEEARLGELRAGTKQMREETEKLEQELRTGLAAMAFSATLSQ